MVYAPKLQKQLNGSATAGEDCWVRSLSMAIDFATRGDVIPSVSAIRDRANVKSGGGNTADQERAAESYDTPNETKQREDIKYDRNVASSWGEQPVAAMDNGEKVVILSIDYGYVNEHKPNLSGDKAFNGNHSVMFGETRMKDGQKQVKAYDSLYDGRRPEIPNGPQWWPMWLARDAAAAFAGNGKWTGGIVPTAWCLPGDEPDPEPEPEPEPSPADKMEQALMEERSALVDFIADAQARIAYVDSIIPPNTAQASAVVSSGTTQEQPAK